MTKKSLPNSVTWPSDWRNFPLWALFDRIKDVGHPSEEMLSVYRGHGVVKKGDRDDNNNQTAENRNIYQLVGPGWFIVNRMKAWQGSVGISPFRGIVSGHYICFRPKHGEDPRYLNWLLRSEIYATEYGRMSRGVRPGQIEVDNDELHSLRIALPPLDEQRRIADFLDAEAGRIDRLRSDQLRMLELLNERIDSRIRGAIGNSQIVDDRGEEVVPIRRLLAKLSRATMSTGTVITAFRDGQITSRDIRRSDGYMLSAVSDPQGQGVEIGDIVVHGLDGFAGAIGDAEASGNCSPVYHVCFPIDGGNPAFYGRMLRVLAITGYLGLFAVSTRERAVDFRNWGLFGNIPVPRIDLSVQHEIGHQIIQSRPLCAEVERFNGLLAERRRALIAAAVTGQIDVTTARGLVPSGGVTA